MAWRTGVLVVAAPEVFYAEDTDGDGRCDRRETILRGFGQGNQQHRVNSLRWDIDGWLSLANGDSDGTIESIKSGRRVDISGRDLRFRVDTGEIEAATGQSQHGRCRDDWGNWFGSNNSFASHYVLEDRYLRRNPRLALSEVRHGLFGVDSRPIFPRSEVVSHYQGYQRPHGDEGHRLTSICGVEVYRDTLLGPAFEGNLFVSEPVHRRRGTRRVRVRVDMRIPPSNHGARRFGPHCARVHDLPSIIGQDLHCLSPIALPTHHR